MSPDLEYERITSSLAAVSRRLALEGIARAVSGLVSAACISGTAAGLAFHWFGGPPPFNVRVAVASFLVVSSTAVIVLVVRRMLHTGVSRRSAASLLACKVPEVDSDCLSCIELYAGPGLCDMSATTRSMIEILLYKTADLCDQLDISKLVPFKTAGKWLISAAVTLLLYLIVVWAVQVDQKDVWNSIAKPWEEPGIGTAVNLQGILGDINAELDYPEYTGLGGKVLQGIDGDLVVPAGTRVMLTAKSSIPLQDARLILPGNEERNVALSDGGRSLAVSFVALATGIYRLAATARDGTKMVESRGHELHAIVDQPPSVELHRPVSGKEVRRHDRVEIEFEAFDDYGIAGIDLVYRREGHEANPTESRKRLISYERWPKQVRRSVGFDLSSIELAPGDDLVLYLEAFDTDSVKGPKSGRSKSVTLKVYSPRTRHEQYISDQEEVRELALRLLADVLDDEQDLSGNTTLKDPTRPARMVEKLDTLANRISQVVKDSRNDPLRDDTAIQVLRRFAAGLRSKSEAGAGLSMLRNRRQLTRRYFRFLASLDPMLERGVLDMTDALDRQRFDQALASARTLGEAQQRLKELLKKYLAAKDPKTKEILRREIERLKRRIAQVMSEIARTAHGVSDEFLNPEAVESRDLMSMLGRLQNALDSGDDQALMDIMDDFERELQNTLAMLEAGSATLADAKFGEVFEKMEDISARLAELEGGERELSQRLDDLLKSYKRKALSRKGQDWQAKKDRLAEMAEKLLSMVEEIGSEAGDTGAYPLYSARERAALLEAQIRVGEVSDAARTARSTVEDLSMFRDELERESMFSFLKQQPTDVEGLSRKVVKAAELAEKIALILENSKPAPPSRVLSSEEKKKTRGLSLKQAAYRKEAKGLSMELIKLMEKLPGLGGDPVAQLSQARYEMSAAEGKLTKLGLKDARESVERAVDRLARARSALQSLRQSIRSGRSSTPGRVRPGLGSMEKVEIPRPEDYRVPKEFREDLLEAMKKPTPKNYEEQVKRYYQELVR